MHNGVSWVEWGGTGGGGGADSDWQISGSDIYSLVAGNVGIGTGAGPGYKLSVDGTASISDDFYVGGDDVLFQPHTDTSNVFVIASSGYTVDDDYPIFTVNTTNARIGIKTTTLEDDFNIGGDRLMRFVGGSGAIRTDSGQWLTMSAGISGDSVVRLLGSQIRMGDIVGIGKGGLDGDFGLEIAASTAAGWFAISSDEAGTANGDIFVIDENEYVGINDNDPSYYLSVDGTASISDSFYAQGPTLFQSNTDTNTFFQIASSSRDGSDAVFSVSTLNNKVGIGTSDTSLGATLTIGGERSIVFTAGNGALRTSNGTLILSATDGRVTISPGDGHPIRMTGPTMLGYNTDPSFGLEISASTSSGWFAISSDEDGTNNGDIFVIDENEHVGINDNNPGYYLSVDGTASISDDFYVGDDMIFVDISASSVSFGASASFNKYVHFTGTDGSGVADPDFLIDGYSYFTDTGYFYNGSIMVYILEADCNLPVEAI